MTRAVPDTHEPGLTPAQVRERFDWAIRSGNPRWLWPDVTIGDWERAVIALQCAIRSVLLQGSAEAPLVGHPRAIDIACYTSGCGPLLGFWRERGLLAADPAVTRVLERHLRHNATRMRALRDHARGVICQFAKHGIAATILKGMHTAFDYFPDPSCRPMSDIDILIDPASEAAAGHALRGMGYEPGATAPVPRQCVWRKVGTTAEPRTLCFVHADDPWAIDLQMSLNRRYSAGAPIVRLDDAQRPRQPLPWSVAPEAQTLPQPLLTIQLACHAGSGGPGNLSLLRLIELVFVIRQDVLAGRLCWEELHSLTTTFGALGSLYPALEMVEQLAPGTVPTEVLAACRAHAPAAVRRVIDRLCPATAQGMTRCSLKERYMWTNSWIGVGRQLTADLTLPGSTSLSGKLLVYRQRAYRLLQGSLTIR